MKSVWTFHFSLTFLIQLFASLLALKLCFNNFTVQTCKWQNDPAGPGMAMKRENNFKACNNTRHRKNCSNVKRFSVFYKTIFSLLLWLRAVLLCLANVKCPCARNYMASSYLLDFMDHLQVPVGVNRAVAELQLLFLHLRVKITGNVCLSSGPNTRTFFQNINSTCLHAGERSLAVRCIPQGGPHRSNPYRRGTFCSWWPVAMVCKHKIALEEFR